MCKKIKGCGRKIDDCMKSFIDTLDSMSSDSYIRPVACCCGHGKYPMTIVVKNSIIDCCWDLISGTMIPRKKKFYKKDKQGYYYIPECVKVRRKGETK